MLVFSVPSHRQVRPWMALVLSPMLLVGGCGDDPKSAIPPDQLARDALTAALDAWKSGTSRGGLKNSPQRVELADSVQNSGAKLASYEIVGSAPSQPGDSNPCFAVKMTLAAGAAEEVVYVVVGVVDKDPIWVFRQRDYQQLGGM